MALRLPASGRVGREFGVREGAINPVYQAWVGAPGRAERLAPGVCYHPEHTAQVVFRFDSPASGPDGEPVSEAWLCLHWIDLDG